MLKRFMHIIPLYIYYCESGTVILLYIFSIRKTYNLSKRFFNLNKCMKAYLYNTLDLLTLYLDWVIIHLIKILSRLYASRLKIQSNCDM